MHSISPYTLRSYNPHSTEKKFEDRYSKLGQAGQSDMFKVFKGYISSQDDTYKLVEDTKQVYRFCDFRFDEARRSIDGWIWAGVYGTKNDIIDIETGKPDFEKTQKHAEIIRHYVRFWIPANLNEGIALLHGFRNHGIKTILFNVLSAEFKRATTFTLHMNPLAYEKAFNEWKDAATKEIKVTRFTGLDDKADIVRKLGHNEVEVSFKRGNLGRLSDYLNPESDQARAIEVLKPLCATVKAKVKVGDKSRTFTLGAPVAQQVCQIELDEEDVLMKDGNPVNESLHGWCTDLLKEYIEILYPRAGVKYE